MTNKLKAWTKEIKNCNECPDFDALHLGMGKYCYRCYKVTEKGMSKVIQRSKEDEDVKFPEWCPLDEKKD